jgi:hypothetical protein
MTQWPSTGTVVESISSAIADIGREMVACGERCGGIHRDQAIGSLPRCLVFETAERAGEGCVVVGINPGRASERERAFYREQQARYEAVVEWFKVVGFTHRYYTSLRRLVTQLGLTGPILWTELAKCENLPEQAGLPPLMTMRRCSGLYLRRELAAVPASWPLVAVGGEAFKALAYLHTDRTVLGVPHPTGSYGHFARLSANGSVREDMVAAASGALSGAPGALLWLG